MTLDEFAAWLRDELREERLVEHQVIDLLAQRQRFDQNRQVIEAEYPLQVVGYAVNQMLVSGSLHELLDRVIEQNPGRMVYFESVGRRPM